MAKLKIRYKSGDEEVHEITERITTLGRTPANTIQLKDSSASRKHCMIKIEADSFLLRDLDSANGVTVNGERIKDHWLTDGDRIQIGTTVMKFLAAEARETF